MNSPRPLFLLGGNVTFEVNAEEFVPVVGGHEAIIALLLPGCEGGVNTCPSTLSPG